MKDVCSFHNVWQLIGNEAMRCITYHLIIGNQVVIRGEHNAMSHRIVHIIQTILPDTCIKVCDNSKTYKYSYECNILSINAPTAELPSDLDPTTFALLDIVYRKESSASRLLSFQTSELSTRYCFLRFKLTSKLFKKTTLGNQLENLWSSAHDPVYEAVKIQQLKSEWSSKARLFGAFAKMPGSEREERLVQFVKSIRLEEDDVPILRFWATGTRALKITNPFLPQ